MSRKKLFTCISCNSFEVKCDIHICLITLWRLNSVKEYVKSKLTVLICTFLPFHPVIIFEKTWRQNLLWRNGSVLMVTVKWPCTCYIGEYVELIWWLSLLKYTWYWQMFLFCFMKSLILTVQGTIFFYLKENVICLVSDFSI